MVEDLWNGFLALLIGFVTMMVPVLVITGFLGSRVPEWVGEEASPRPAARSLSHPGLGRRERAPESTVRNGQHLVHRWRRT